MEPDDRIALAAGDVPAARDEPRLETCLGAELCLDPPDWDAFAVIAHRALDEAVTLMRTVRDRPPWRPMPESVRASLEEPMPWDGAPLATVMELYRDAIAPYPTGNAHPRFWGWVMGNGTADGMLADLLASAMNPHLAGYDQSAPVVERQVLRWLAEALGMPADTSGLLVSGGTAANLTGLAVARHDRCGFDVRDEGLSGHPQLCCYGSSETHSWAEKAADLLGLGRAALRRLPADAHGRADARRIREEVRSDRARGMRPFCVIGNAGTVDAGAIDPLDELADLCAEEGLWLHVDGAFGALVALVPGLRDRLRGLERADSVAFDLHKWGYLQYELGCVLVRDAAAHRATFATSADYLESPGRGIMPTPLELAQLGVQLSRGFRALKAWMAIKTHGLRRIGEVIEQNVEQAQYLRRRVEAEPELELLGPAPLNVVCFRYRPGRVLAERELEDLNREILLCVQERGIAVPSSTRRGGAFALRVAITNHRTRLADVELFADAVLALGRELEAARQPLDRAAK